MLSKRSLIAGRAVCSVRQYGSTGLHHSSTKYPARLLRWWRRRLTNWLLCNSYGGCQVDAETLFAASRKLDVHLVFSGAHDVSDHTACRDSLHKIWIFDSTCVISSQYSRLDPLDHLQTTVHWSFSSNHQLTPVSRSQTAFLAWCTSLVEQTSSYSSCSLSVRCAHAGQTDRLTDGVHCTRRLPSERVA